MSEHPKIGDPMKDITITFSADEIDLLVRQVFLGEYMLEAGDESESGKGYELLNKLLEACRLSNVLGPLERSDIDGKNLIPAEMEQELVSLIDEYDEDAFLESLLDELVGNEIEQTVSPRILANLSEERYAEMSADLEKKYVEEFQANGYKNLTIPGLR